MSDLAAGGIPKFRICTLVTDSVQYGAMRSSFEAAGFNSANSRYSLFDNTAGNAWEPYGLVNRLIDETPEPYLILCHQDVRADRGYGAAELWRAIEHLGRIDPAWGVAGNAGCTDDFDFVMRLADPNGFPMWLGPLPLEANSLDENFLLMRTASRVRASGSLAGFHLYGTDLCVNARLSGHGCYVIDFVLTHLSVGKFGPDFFQVRDQFLRRWNAEFNFLYLLREAEIFLSRWPWLRKIGPKGRVKRLLRRNRWFRRLMTWELRPRRGTGRSRN